MNSKNIFGRNNWTVLILFGLIGQIAWSVENMFFNLFVYYEVDTNLEAVKLMVQLSGVAATVATLIAGALSDKVGNRARFISIGYTVWGVTVALFGFLTRDFVADVLNMSDPIDAIPLTLAAVIIGDCIMTVFGSTANDACFNAWVTDNTNSSIRGKVEGVVAILPLIALLIVGGGFGFLTDAFGYTAVFLVLGIIISACGVVGMFIIKDSDTLEKNGTVKDIFYGFKPSVIKANKSLYITFVIVLIYGIACQVFMPYFLIYMTEYLGFEPLEYSIVFGASILIGAVINIFLGRLSDKKDKRKLLYIAAGIMSAGLFAMYFASFAKNAPIACLILFGIAGFVMITGYIFVSALSGAIVRDNTPTESAGKLQGVRMVFSVLIPMIIGPEIGMAINRSMNIEIENPEDLAMTTSYIPAPEIFLVGGIITLLLIGGAWILCRQDKKEKANG